MAKDRLPHKLAVFLQADVAGMSLISQRGGFKHLVVTSLLLLATAFLSPVYAADFDYPIKQITGKIQVIFGPLDLPDSTNRGFRNNVITVVVLKEDRIIVVENGNPITGPCNETIGIDGLDFSFHSPCSSRA